MVILGHAGALSASEYRTMPRSRSTLSLATTLAITAGALVAGTAVPTTAAAAAASPAPAAAGDHTLTAGLSSLLARSTARDRVPVIVTLRDTPSASRLARLERDAGDLGVERRLGLVRAFAARLGPAGIRALAAHPHVVSVEEDAPVRAYNDSAQESFGVTAARLAVPGLDGDGDGDPSRHSRDDLVAAVLDTGIDAGHLDLDEGKVIAFKDLVNGRTAAYDDQGHGTHVAATIAGDGDGRADGRHRGVAPAAALVGVKVLDATGSGTTSDIVAGLDWVVANKDVHGIEAVNLSLGSRGCFDGTDALSRAVDAASATGLVVTVAAGNAGPGLCTIGSPGVAAGAITVGAMADTGVNGFRQAHFSSRGPTADGRIKPDVTAAGVSVTSARAGTVSDYTVMSGTSMAAPFVAGVALLMRDAAPSLTPAQVRAALGGTAVDWGLPGPDIDYGAGRLDAYAALAAAGVSPLTAPPRGPAHAVVQGSVPGTGAVSEHSLEVTDASFPIAATLLHRGMTSATATTPNLDLALVDRSGAVVARATTNRRQDELGYRPTTSGSYVLRVTSASGSGDYVLDVSAGGQLVARDTTAPLVQRVEPATGATGVPVGAPVSVVFSEEMDRTATTTALAVRKADGTSGAVPGTLAWNGTTLTLDPAADLEPATGYTATVSTQARDVAGNPLSSPVTWTFTTAAAPVTVRTVTAVPQATTIETGRHRSGGLRELSADDGRYFRVYSAASVSSWYASIPQVSNDAKDLVVTYQGASTKKCQQTVSVWNWSSSRWQPLDTRSVLGSRTLTLRPSGAPADYVSGDVGNGELRIQARCARSSGSYTHKTDVVQLRYEVTSTGS
jgi:serine protease AprX